MVLFVFCFFFFNDTATTEIYTHSLYDALPILATRHSALAAAARIGSRTAAQAAAARWRARSEEHTSELQSRENLVCRLLLEKKKIITDPTLFTLDDDGLCKVSVRVSEASVATM